MSRPTTPHWQRPQTIAPARFGLIPFRSPLLRESMFLSLPQATKMFQFACLPPLRLWIQRRVPAVSRRWVSPFGNPRINARSAAPRGLSQPSTSFIGIRRQGIHRWLFIAWKSLQKDARACYRILKEQSGRANAPLENGTEEDRAPRARTERSKPAIGGHVLEARVASDRLGVCHEMWQLSLERR